MPKMNSRLIATIQMPDRTIMAGTSRCGFLISSLAEFESSKPTRKNCNKPNTPRKPATVGLRLPSVIVPAGLPCFIR